MNRNKLMLNTDKTEVVAVAFRFSLVDCSSVNIGVTNISFKTYVKYLIVKIDRTLRAESNQQCLSCLFSLIMTPCVHLTLPLQKNFCETSRCFYHLPPQLLQISLTRFANGTNRSIAECSDRSTAARLVLKKRQQDHIKAPLKELSRPLAVCEIPLPVQDGNPHLPSLQRCIPILVLGFARH